VNPVEKRQAMGIYISNYRDRLDISYILYHPQRPLVMTRTSKYMYADILPSGENVVVAVACYTGLMLAHVTKKIVASLS
jgi:DNA-directed RNA polymerase II subunit RPB2